MLVAFVSPTAKGPVDLIGAIFDILISMVAGVRYGGAVETDAMAGRQRT